MASETDPPITTNESDTGTAGSRRLGALRSLGSHAAPAGVLSALALAVGTVVPSFFSLYSLGVVAGESSVILLLATGQTPVMILGRIDLSVAALASFTSVLIALLLPKFGAAGVGGALCLATLIGGLQGFVHARAQIPSFIVTIAGLELWSGIALAIAHATIPISGGYEIVGWLEYRRFGVPQSFLFGLAVLCLVQVAIGRLPLGRYLFAIGMEERVALLSGIRVWRVKVIAFAASGLCSGLAGMAMAARTSSGNLSIADSLLLPSIAAVVVGGTAITGGYGGLGRTLVGVLIVTVLRVGISLTGIDPGYEPVAYGVMLMIAVSLTVDRAKIGVVK